jgi:hypothetical protein
VELGLSYLRNSTAVGIGKQEAKIKKIIGDWTKLRNRQLLDLYLSRTTVEVPIRWPRGLRCASGIAVSNPAGRKDVALMSVVRCPIAVSATDQLLVQKSPTECGVSECDLETWQ